MNTNCFIEADYCQKCKSGQNIAGDVFLSTRMNSGKRVVLVLADGLGSGVEACVLASLTARMALEYVTGNIDTERAAEIIMDALPLCPKRKISYSAFSIVDADIHGTTKIMEQGNPSFIFIRDGEILPVESQNRTEVRWQNRVLSYAELKCTFGDRVVFFSDGISQAGIGLDEYPLGWGRDGVGEFLLGHIRRNPEISASMLSKLLVDEAVRKDNGRAGDDITCAVVYYRNPRQLLVLTGPPYDMSRDREYGMLAEKHVGSIAVCGGTTSNIVARELDRSVTMNLHDIDYEIPTTSDIEGIDLVTEGCLTLSKTAELLESGMLPGRRNGATRLYDLLLQSDIIRFVVGTRINEAHHNPQLPVELEIRRNVVKKIVRLLEEKHLKETSIEYI